MTTREDRFRSLPLHGRLAVVVKQLGSLLQAVQAANPGIPVVPTSLWSTVEIGARVCVDRLDEEEMEAIERLLRQLIALDPESRCLRWPETAESLIAATKAALQGAVDTGVRMLLAVKALQASAVETVVRELDEAFLTLVDAVEDFSAATSLTRSEGLPGGVSRFSLAHIDRDIESLDLLADAADSDNSAYLSPDDLVSVLESEHLYERGEPAASTDGTPFSGRAQSRTSPSAGSHGRNAGVGILVMFLLSGLLSVLRHAPQWNRANKPQRPPAQQRAPWDDLRRQEVPPGLGRLGDMRAVMTLHDTLQEAEQADKAGDKERVDAALQKAHAELEKVDGLDTLSDSVAEILVRLTWKYGELLQSRDLEQALATYDKGCQLASQLLERRGTAADRSRLAALLNNKANALSSLGRHEETVGLLSQAVELQTAALDAEPDNDTYRTFLRHHLTNQMHSYLELKRWKEGAEAAQQWCEVSSKNEQALYESACLLARVATAIRDGAEEGELRSELVGQLVLQATQLLRMARGPDVRIEDEIRQNASLGILGTPVPETLRRGADP